MLDDFRVVPSNDAEASLLRSVDRDALKNKDLVLKVLKGMRDDPNTGSNNAGQCYEGCPPQIGDDFLNSLIEELENKELIIITWIAEEEKQGTDLKKELLTAFQQANNHRLMQVIERNKLIDETKFYRRAPDAIPMVHEKALTEEEILNFVSPELKEEIKTSEALDQMMGRLKEAETGAIKTEFWDTMGQSTASTARSIYNSASNKFMGVDNRISKGETANTNYAAFGLTDQQVDQYVKDKLAEGESVFWISAKLIGKEFTYNVWNFATWGTLKENDLLAVQYTDNEIDEGEMYRLQALNGFTALLMASTSGLALRAQAFKPLANVSVKSATVGGGASYSASVGIQYLVNGKVDQNSAIISGVTGTFLPAYGLKGLLAVSNTGAYLDQVRQDKSLVDTAFSLTINSMANLFGYGVSHLYVNNPKIFDNTLQSYRTNLYKNNGQNYIHNYKSFLNSTELEKSVITGGVLGTSATEYFNQGITKGLSNDEE